MTFHPQINDKLKIGSESYVFTEHPSAKGMPYGQAGRRATVYQVRNSSMQLRALKVFTPAFRSPRIEEQADTMARYSTLPGLIACKRIVISPTDNPKIVSAYPDLSYSVLMPWLQGTTWQEVVMNRQFMTKENSLGIAERFLTVLAIMESEGIAHCDLSGPNLILNMNSSQSSSNGHNRITLIDLEDMYAKDLKKPVKLPAGSAGYAHREVKTGIWCAEADRFSGAVLLANILGWSNRTIRDKAYGEQYFDTDEIQEDCERYEKLVNVLDNEWGSLPTNLFKQAWLSSSLETCPRFSEWTEALKVEIPKVEIDTIRTPLIETPSVLSGGPVTGWRSITGGSVASDNQTGKYDPVEPKDARQYFYEFEEWNKVQTRRKLGYKDQDRTSEQDSSNKYNPYLSENSDDHHDAVPIGFWVFIISGLIGLILLLLSSF